MPDPKLWLKIALSNLESAIILMNANKFNEAAYYAQQTAEKVLKGYLELQEAPVKKIHDLTLLVRECADFDSSFMELITPAKELKPFSTKSRYPDDYVDLEIEDVKLLIESADAIVKFVTKFYDQPIQKRLPLK
jgi:HEPN domain-containing protein